MHVIDTCQSAIPNGIGSIKLFLQAMTTKFQYLINSSVKKKNLSELVFNQISPAISPSPHQRTPINHVLGVLTIRYSALFSQQFSQKKRTELIPFLHVVGSPELKDAMFHVLCLIPLLVSLIQITAWWFYPLKQPQKCTGNRVPCTDTKQSI